MTFDEAQNLLLEQRLDEEVVSLVIYVMDTLKDTYAPTVEMTKDKVDQLNNLVHTVGEEFEENELPEDGSVKITDKMIELEDGFVLLKDLNVILHPETINIIDEDIANDSKRTNG